MRDMDGGDVSVRLLAIVILLCTAIPVQAQEVKPLPDWVSYGTAGVDAAKSAFDAWRAPDRGCRFARLGLSEAIGNGVTLAVKHFVHSDRPCSGYTASCGSDGQPSGHTVNSFIGGLDSPRLGWSFGVTTGLLRSAANRHFPFQIYTGALIGIGADLLPRAFLHCQE